jgi:hypothetical protein
MLNDTDRDEVARQFANDVFVVPNVCATINLDDIRAEITAICTDIDGGTGEHVPAIAENLDWSTTLADLIGAKL